MRADRSLLVGLFLICFANLLLEVVITRLFSATMFYHFTFLAIALALFGIAASGVHVFIVGDSLAADLRGEMARAARRFALSSVVALAYAMANPMDIIIVTGSNAIPVFTARQGWQLLFLVGITAIPFFYAGKVVSLALAFLRQDTARVYAWDLAGAACAAVVTGLVLSLIGGPNAVLFAALVALVGAALVEGRGKLRWIAVGAGALVLVWNMGSQLIRVPTAKGVKVETTTFEQWNSFSRVTVDNTRTIKIDASAATHIEDLRALKPDMHKVEISALAHSMFETPADQALIIGPGGGRDVLHALSAGTKRVTGVEVNPIIAETIMKGAFAEVSGGLYKDPRVNVVVDDGRSFVRRTPERYDLVQASLVDTWAATAAGAFALTENALYTREAFEDYIGHLSDRGAVTITRWHTGARSETARLLILGLAALDSLGVKDLKAHVFYAYSKKNGLGTMILKRVPFTPDEVARLEAASAAGGFVVAVSPSGGTDPALRAYVDAGPYSAAVTDAPEELRPPTDDQPFFFYFKKARELLTPTRLMNDPALWIIISLGAVLLLSAIFIIAPIVVHWMRTGQAIGSRANGMALGYFALVGFAFMTFEIALLQRFTLFLGHPSYSLMVILFAVLLSTAAGAALSAKIAPKNLGTLMAISGGALAVFALISAYVMPIMIHALIALPLPARIAITIVAVAPIGVLMGVMVPSIIRSLESETGIVPWGWAVNGATSVVGTVLATVIAIYAGFSTTFIVAAVCYAGAGVLGRSITRQVSG